MKKIKLFCDGSVHPQSKIGFASYLYLKGDNYKIDELREQIRLKKFEETSSTKLELQGLLWALKEHKSNDFLVVYTDCQNILSLLNRREKLETSFYITGKGTKVKNELLYKEFFSLLDKLNCEFIKIKGHKKSSLKDEIDKIFSLVDKSSRQELRNYLKR